eukprot:CAMPEP_0182424638 /NCGR_PEP_ID=MMETSP1167-20130531/10868_1 /TAXON_ID=2988 /ORGANISM="Mallomonas Sp, Strain CCMP3275" /LENGTH=181 /DNA_ID=CAMNT_0024604607 /DNA_START=948 /DNA_END=1493 /DNA_ORIENTATION=-
MARWRQVREKRGTSSASASFGFGNIFLANKIAPSDTRSRAEESYNALKARGLVVRVAEVMYAARYWELCLNFATVTACRILLEKLPKPARLHRSTISTGASSEDTLTRDSCLEDSSPVTSCSSLPAHTSELLLLLVPSVKLLPCLSPPSQRMLSLASSSGDTTSFHTSATRTSHCIRSTGN